MKIPEWSVGIGKDLLRLKDGDVIPGTFRGDIVRFYQHWGNGFGIVCPGKTSCALCAKGEKGTNRFRVNFLTIIEDKWVAKIFEGGKRVFDQIVSLNKDMPLESARCKIARNGTGKQATTLISIYPGENGIVDKKLDKILNAVELHDIAATVTPEAEAEELGSEEVPDFATE